MTENWIMTESSLHTEGVMATSHTELPYDYPTVLQRSSRYSAPSMRDLEARASRVGSGGSVTSQKAPLYRRLRPSWAQLMVGFAMVGRGEFAYLVAETMNKKLMPQADPNLAPRKMMSDEVYVEI